MSHIILKHHIINVVYYIFIENKSISNNIKNIYIFNIIRPFYIINHNKH